MKKIIITFFLLVSFLLGYGSTFADYKWKCDQYINFFSKSSFISSDNSSKKSNWFIIDTKNWTGAQVQFDEKSQQDFLNRNTNLLSLLDAPEIKNQCPGIAKINISTDPYTKFTTDNMYNYTYCAVGVILTWDGKKYATEDDLIADGDNYIMEDSKDTTVVDCASAYQRMLIMYKKNLLSAKWKDLKSEDSGLLTEFEQWLDCWGLDTEDWGIAMCVNDSRKYEKKLNLKYTGTFAGGKIWWYSMWNGLKNSLIKGVSYLTKQSSWLGFNIIDQLPDFAYSFKDIFDKSTVYGLINSFTLPLYSILILYYFLRKWIGRDEDDYRIFVIKLIIILAFTIWFWAFYNLLKWVLANAEEVLLSWLEQITQSQYSKQAIELSIFDTSWGASLTWWWVLWFIFNAILLLVISMIVRIRDGFLYFLSLILLITSSWLLIGSTKSNNIGWSAISKGGKFLSKWFYLAVSVYVSFVIHILFLKLVTVILLTLPSIENSSVTFIDSLSTMGISTFIYLLLILVSFWLYVRFIIPITYNVVSAFFHDIFFHWEEIGTFKDFSQDLWDSWKEVKMFWSDTLENNRYVASGADMVRNTGLYKNVEAALWDENSLIRQTLDNKWVKRVGRWIAVSTKLATWLWEITDPKTLAKSSIMTLLWYKDADETGMLTNESYKKMQSLSLDTEIKRLESLKKSTDSDYRKRKLDSQIRKLQDNKFGIYKEINFKNNVNELYDILDALTYYKEKWGNEENIVALEKDRNHILSEMKPFLEWYKVNSFLPFVNSITDQMSSLDKDILWDSMYESARSKLQEKITNKYAEVLWEVETFKLHQLDREYAILEASGWESRELWTLKKERDQIQEEMWKFGYNPWDYEHINEKVDAAFDEISDFKLSKNEEEELEKSIKELAKEQSIWGYTESYTPTFNILDKFWELKKLNSTMVDLDLEFQKFMSWKYEEELNLTDEQKQQVLDKYQNIKARRVEVTSVMKEVANAIKSKKTDTYDDDFEQKYIDDLIADNIELVNEFIYGAPKVEESKTSGNSQIVWEFDTQVTDIDRDVQFN